MKLDKTTKMTGVILLAMLLSPPAFAQFKKYKSKSQFTAPKGEAATTPTLDMSDIDDEDQEVIDTTSSSEGSPSSSVRPMLDKAAGESGTDAFGRDRDISVGDLPPKDKKYINLNPETAFGPEVVTSFDFPDTSLVDLTKHMQQLTGINLILEKDIKGKISILAPSPITVGDAWKAYLTALNVNGYTLVKSGAFYKIVNARDIRYTPTKIYTGTYTPNTENYVMRILPLKNIDSMEVTRSFRPFMSRYGRIIDIKQTNTIIVQDTGSNVNRLVRLIRFIDVPGHEETLQIIPVKNSSAQEIAKLLDTILRSKGPAKFKTAGAAKGKDDDNISKIIAEPRTNSIIAMANADGAKQLRSLIAKLDVKVSNAGSGQIHVYYLNHSDAESISKTLSSLISGSAPKNKGTRFTKAPGADDGESLFSDEVKITADKDNNALVIVASPTDYITVQNVISKLDIPRAQVYVEGMIMETQVNKGDGFGITLVGAYGSGGAQKAGFVGGTGGQDLLNVLTNNITSLGGLFVGGGTGGKVTLGIGGNNVEVNTVTGLITAIANTSNTNVLATPQILALDNTEASFEVGESVPVQEQTIANNQTQISVKQQTAGLSLKLTPQINKVTRYVKLKIDQKIEEFQTRANAAASGGVATTNRAAVTTVVVRDKDTIAMGGLMRDQAISNTSKVPLLGDIPILGWLFKNTSSTVSKVNMLFFLTPRIMDSPQAVGGSVKENLNKRAAFLQDIVGENDRYKTTVKNLFQKATDQENAPTVPRDGLNLQYNNETIDQKKMELEKSENSLDSEDPVDAEFEADEETANFQVPNYKAIAQEVKIKQSAVKKK